MTCQCVLDHDFAHAGECLVCRGTVDEPAESERVCDCLEGDLWCECMKAPWR